MLRRSRTIFPDLIHRTWDHWLGIFAWRIFVARIKDDIFRFMDVRYDMTGYICLPGECSLRGLRTIFSGLGTLDMTWQARFGCQEGLYWDYEGQYFAGLRGPPDGRTDPISCLESFN